MSDPAAQPEHRSAATAASTSAPTTITSGSGTSSRPASSGVAVSTRQGQGAVAGEPDLVDRGRVAGTAYAWSVLETTTCSRWPTGTWWATAGSAT